MNMPIKTDGRIYLNLEIDLKTAYNILCRECIENDKFVLENENDDASKAMINSLTTIRDKYSKVFGKDGEEALLPVKGFFDSEKNSFYITSNEVIKGLFHVFKKYDMGYIDVSSRGICRVLWDHIHPPINDLLYEGQDAIDVYNAMKWIEFRYGEFVQENNESVEQIKILYLD